MWCVCVEHETRDDHSRREHSSMPAAAPPRCQLLLSTSWIIFHLNCYNQTRAVPNFFFLPFFLFLLLLRFLLLWQRHTFVDDDDNFPPSPMEHKHNTKHFEYKSKKEGYLEFIMINSLNAGISSRSHQPPTKHNT